MRQLIKEFIIRECEFIEGGVVTPEELLERWNNECRRTGALGRIISTTSIGLYMRSLFPEQVRHRRQLFNKKQRWVYSGIRLKST